MVWHGKLVHFIGIGGIGMSGIAKTLLSQGCRVTGSDILRSRVTEELEKKGAKVFYEHDTANVDSDVDMIVMSAAIKEDNPEVEAALEMERAPIKYADMLGRLMAEHRGIAVCGSHGKTTTAAMISHVMVEAGLDPTYVIGGDVPDLCGSSGIGSGEFFIAEACEFDRSFLNLSPEIAAVVNIDEDHLDCYGTIDEIIKAFSEFFAGIPADGLLVANGQDHYVEKALSGISCEVEKFGIDADTFWNAGDVDFNGQTTFSVSRSGAHFGAFEIRLPGMYNVFNALAAIAICSNVGVASEEISKYLKGFSGVNRRFEIMGDADGVTVVDDYAHHPTEIQATLKAAADFFPKRRLWVVFQPHQHSRTRFLMKDFARSFGRADRIILPDIYFVRDSADAKKTVSSKDLVDRIVNLGGVAQYVPDFKEIVDIVDGEISTGDVLITMGAGDVWQVAEDFLHRRDAARK